MLLVHDLGSRSERHAGARHLGDLVAAEAEHSTLVEELRAAPLPKNPSPRERPTRLGGGVPEAGISLCV